MIELRFCRNCESPINGRLDKKHCSGNCRKRFSECRQNSIESREKRNKNYRLFDRAARLAEIYFNKPPFERLGMMQNYINLARNEDNHTLREVLSNKWLKDRRNTYGNPFKGKRGISCGSLAEEAERYCQKFWKASAYDVVFGLAKEPEDGVID